MVGCCRMQCDENDGKVSLRVAGFALSVGELVRHSSVGVELDGFFRVFVFYRGRASYVLSFGCYVYVLHFSYFLFFHRVCFIVTLNTHMDL